MNIAKESDIGLEPHFKPLCFGDNLENTDPDHYKKEDLKEKLMQV
jgi:hypothetical protein